MRQYFFVFFAAFLAVEIAGAQQGSGGRGIGYPSVAVALEALKARNDVQISNQGGWIIVNDKMANALWSFTPPDHPAYPAAVRRAVVQRGTAVSIEMTALCQAEKSACDKLMAEFKELNEKTAASVQARVKGAQEEWRPTEEQASLANATLTRFLRALDEGRHQDAYDQFTVGMKLLMTPEAFASMEKSLMTKDGGPPTQTEPRITWYKDAPKAAAPGIYAAFDIPCRLPSIGTCLETVILHEQSGGEFQVMRKERTVVNKEAEQKGP